MTSISNPTEEPAAEAEAIPQRPPQKQTHLLWAPELPPVPPITTPGVARKSLLLVPIEVGLRPECKEWLDRFCQSRRSTSTARAKRAQLDAVVDAESRMSRELRAANVEPSRKGRGGREFASDREAAAIRALNSRAKDDLSLALYGTTLNGATSFSFLEPNVLLAPGVAADYRLRTPVSPDLFLRVAYALYDEVILLASEARHRGVVRRWGKAPRAWVVAFRDQAK